MSYHLLEEPVRRFFSLTVIATACLLAACGGQPGFGSGSSNSHGSAGTPAPSPTGGVLSTGPAGFGGNPPDPSVSYPGNPTAGVVLTNESKDLVAEQVKVQWTIYNMHGGVLDSKSTNLAVVRAGQVLPIIMPLYTHKTTDIGSVKVQTLVHFWRTDTNPRGIITTKSVNVGPTRSRQTWNVSGELNNGYSSNLERVPTYIYCTDSSGKFVGGHVATASLLPANGTGSVSGEVSTPSAPTSCEMNAVPMTIPPD